MRTRLSKPFLFVARNYLIIVRGFLSLLPVPLHRPWIAQQMLRATSGFNLVALTPRKILIKIDVERTELSVLRGAVKLFEYEPTVIVESNDWSDDLEKIVRFFEERKYILQAISDSGLRSGFSIDELFPERRQSNYVNILAKPPEG
jgi:Methyltransferase FkbM domain